MIYPIVELLPGHPPPLPTHPNPIKPCRLQYCTMARRPRSTFLRRRWTCGCPCITPEQVTHKHFESVNSVSSQCAFTPERVSCKTSMSDQNKEMQAQLDKLIQEKPNMQAYMQSMNASAFPKGTEHPTSSGISSVPKRITVKESNSQSIHRRMNKQLTLKPTQNPQTALRIPAMRMRNTQKRNG